MGLVASELTKGMEAQAMLVRLAVAWTDPGGLVHSAGELVDVDPVTLAVLEEQNMVENADSGAETPWVGPGSTEPPKEDANGAQTQWVGPGSTEPDTTDDDGGTTDDGGDATADGWVGPGAA